MSDTLPEREDQMTTIGFCAECQGYTHVPWCSAYQTANTGAIAFVDGTLRDTKDTSQLATTHEHQSAARGGGDHGELRPGMNPTCLRCFNDGWDAHKRGLHPANFHAGFATQDAPHTCNQHQSLVAERDAGLRAIAYLICDGIVNSDKYYPPEMATWARDLMVNEQRVGIQLIREAIGINEQRSTSE